MLLVGNFKQKAIIAIILLMMHKEKVYNNIYALSTLIQEELINKGIIEAEEWKIEHQNAGYYSPILDSFIQGGVSIGKIEVYPKQGTNRLLEKIWLTEDGVKSYGRIIVEGIQEGYSKKIISVLNAFGIESIEGFAYLLTVK